MTPFMWTWADLAVHEETALDTCKWFHMLPLTLCFGFIIRKLANPCRTDGYDFQFMLRQIETVLTFCRNVDRLFAIWQAMNPNSYVTSQAASQETVTTEAGTLETETSDLTPFWASSDAFWNSDGVRKTGTLGYAYPETQSWNFKTPQEYSANVRATVRKLYGGSSLASILADSTPGNLSNSAKLIVPSKASAQPASKENVPPAKTSAAERLKPTSSKAMKEPVSVQQVKGGDQKPLGAKPQHEEPKAVAKAEPEHNVPKSAPEHENHPKRKSGPMLLIHFKCTSSMLLDRDLTDLTTNGKYLEWIVNFKVEKHTLGGTFSVHVFLGDFERDDPSAWHSTANKVGSFNVLGDAESTGCGKCRSDRERRLIVTGQVPLTLALAERYLAGEVANLKPEGVIPYLQTHLHWRITFVRIPSYPFFVQLVSHPSPFLVQLVSHPVPLTPVLLCRVMGPRSRAAKCRPSRSRSSATK